MRTTRIWITLGCFLIMAPLLAPAQSQSRAPESKRRAGLWELTTTTSAQSSSGRRMPGRSTSPLHPSTQMVCLTEEMIAKFGAPLPPVAGSCHIASLDRRPTSMTLQLDCTGRMVGKMEQESSWSVDHGTTTVHFIGTELTGAENRPVEWTAHSVAVFKDAACGGVKPYPMPN